MIYYDSFGRMLGNILLFLLVVLIALIIAYSIIMRRYTSGKLFIGLKAGLQDDPTALVDGEVNIGEGTSGTIGTSTQIFSGVFALTDIQLNSTEIVIPLRENSLKRQLYGGVYLNASATSTTGTNAKVKFTIKDESTKIGERDYTFKSADGWETVLIKFDAPKSTTDHSIGIESDKALKVLDASYYYY